MNHRASIGEVQVEHHGSDVWIVSLLGEHDLSNASELQDRLRDVHTHGTRVVLDLSRASFIDSTVIHCIANEAGKAARKPTSDLAVVAPTGSQPHKLLELVHLTTVRVTHTRDDALKAVTGGVNGSDGQATASHA